MDFIKIEKDFKSLSLRNEDDVKIHFHSDIVKPILTVVNPSMLNHYKSEDNLLAGGRTDATFQNISFEFKKNDYFRTPKGVNEALYGRDSKDHGLYDYIISSSGINDGDSEELVEHKLKSGIGVGFDGVKFIFARFVPSTKKTTINTAKVKTNIPFQLNLAFSYEVKDFQSGLKRLSMLLKQQGRLTLNKSNLLNTINVKSTFVRENIIKIYDMVKFNLYNLDGSNRVRTLYKEWDRVFGIMYGVDTEATDFTEVSSKIKDAYGIDAKTDIDSKMYLFSMQTFFNIFLKLLVYSFLSQLVDPTFTIQQQFTKPEINRLFSGSSINNKRLVNNFFEAHFLEWFIFSDDAFEVNVVNDTLKQLDCFDLTTFVIKPEDVQDILQEVYMELIPKEMRHLMGEYFSPDWIVEHSLDMIKYNGDIDKTLIDPTAGSGTFLTHAIKRIIKSKKESITKSDIEIITNNIVGFDINPISVVMAKTNYILILFSAYFANSNEDFGEAVNIPIFIADSVLSPVVYTEENGDTLKLETSVGIMELPKFKNFAVGNEFLSHLSDFIRREEFYNNFENVVVAKKLIDPKDTTIVKKLFEQLEVLHSSAKDSFWPIVLRNSFAPTMIRNKFDYVVGNPPWIAWKAMSRSYRTGTLTIWQSYGIFEKNAYDKKTTHDDFGMAVTYVAVDQYLKEGGSMVFLLPASFLKSTKGGEGFRKFEIIRNNQSVPFAVEEVHDFSKVKLFTIPTVAIRFSKGNKMHYPMNTYRVYSQTNRRKIDSHAKWDMVSNWLTYQDLIAQPVDLNDVQSAWLTLGNMSFANNVLDKNKPRHYKGRKGIEPAGAKGVYILKTPVRKKNGNLIIENDMSRQRRQDVIDMGVHRGEVEETYIFPMLGGRNIAKWRVKSNEFMIVPHTATYKYGIPVDILSQTAPDTYLWLNYYHDVLLDTRIQNGKFFNQDTQPFYRLDNVGEYTYSPYKVLWKEQTGSMSAVVVGSYLESIPNADPTLFSEDKPIVVDSKVLMLDVYDEMEAYYVCGIINSYSVTNVIDGYAISTNRGVDVLKYVAIPLFDKSNSLHLEIAMKSKEIHLAAKNTVSDNSIPALEKDLDALVVKLFS